MTTRTKEFVNPREVYGKLLAELGEADGRVVALSADVTASNKFHYFAQRFPARFFNAGIAEQDMVGIAAGMALEGKLPFVTTFAPFLSMRACEQVRTDVCYPCLPVKLIGSCGGVAGGKMGSTHCALEDIAILRGMPNMAVIAPADPYVCGQLFTQMAHLPGPAYLRVGRGEDPVLYGPEVRAQLGKALLAAPGRDATIIACGSAVAAALAASQSLQQKGIGVRVLDMHTIAPLDTEAVLRAAEETQAILTAEDHFITGGLGSAVAEVLADHGLGVPFKRLGIPGRFPVFGDGPELYRHYGFDAAGMAAAVLELLA